MNNREAITLLRNLEDSLDSYCELNEEGKTAFRMAIEALNCSEFPNNSDTISRQAAIEMLMNQNVIMDGSEYHNGFNAGVNRAQEVIRNLPTLQSYVPVINVGDMISREGAIDALDCINGVEEVLRSLPSAQPTITHEQAIDYLHETGWLQNHDRILTESKIVPPVQLKNGTLIIPLNESDFKSVKRIMLDNKPWCRTFYEDVPGEAHWIKSYTPDDGEIYECDNCGVTWQFNDGGPEENKAFYCPKCGFKMVPKEGEANGQE